MVADGQLVVPGRDGAVLLESSDRPLDHVALAVAHRIDQRRPATPGAPAGSGLLLVAALGDGVSDPPLTQQPPAGAVAVAAVGDQMGWPFTGPPQPAWARDPDGVQQRLKLGALVALAGGDQYGQRPPTAIAGQVDLGREPAPAASQCLVSLGSRP